MEQTSRGSFGLNKSTTVQFYYHQHVQTFNYLIAYEYVNRINNFLPRQPDPRVDCETAGVCYWCRISTQTHRHCGRNVQFALASVNNTTKPEN